MRRLTRRPEAVDLHLVVEGPQTNGMVRYVVVRCRTRHYPAYHGEEYLLVAGHDFDEPCLARLCSLPPLVFQALQTARADNMTMADLAALGVNPNWSRAIADDDGRLTRTPLKNEDDTPKLNAEGKQEYSETTTTAREAGYTGPVAEYPAEPEANDPGFLEGSDGGEDKHFGVTLYKYGLARDAERYRKLQALIANPELLDKISV